jgi:hypothetical protein
LEEARKGGWSGWMKWGRWGGKEKEGQELLSPLSPIGQLSIVHACAQILDILLTFELMKWTAAEINLKRDETVGRS